MQPLAKSLSLTQLGWSHLSLTSRLSLSSCELGSCAQLPQGLPQTGIRAANSPNPPVDLGSRSFGLAVLGEDSWGAVQFAASWPCPGALQLPSEGSEVGHPCPSCYVTFSLRCRK
jgi:hypothetical protein